jgi:hypothetical protein
VTASGLGTLHFQWKFNGSNVGTDINTYTRSNCQISDNGATVVCVVSNPSGSVTSSAATLSVGPDPVINTQPQSASAYVSQTAIFNVVATGADTISYQWKTNGVNAGTNGPALAVGPVVMAWNGMAIVVTVTDSAGSLGSSAAALTVLADPVIHGHPHNKTVHSGQTATFSVDATGQSALSYQWITNGVDVAAGGTSATFTWPPTVLADTGSTVQVTVTDTAGSLASDIATLFVNADTVITSQPQSTTAVLGNPATFSVTAAGTPTLSYQWRKNSSAIGGATDAAYTTTVDCPDNGALFDCVVTSSGTMETATSDPATLTVTGCTIARVTNLHVGGTRAGQ